MDGLLSSTFAPFTGALALLFALFLLEIVLLLVGGSLFTGGDAPDLGADIDLDADLDLDLSNDLEAPTGTSSGGILAALGLADAPLMVWVASVLLGFGLSGLAVQGAANAALGAPLPGWVAAIPAAAAALGFARRFTGLFGRLLPQNYSEAVSETQLGRRRGIITVGTAARGRPAEVRVTDRHGNMHYLRAEPMSDTDTLPQGTEVLVLRDPRSRSYRLLPLS